MPKKEIKVEELNEVAGGEEKFTTHGEQKCAKCGKVLPVGSTGCINYIKGEWCCWDCHERIWDETEKSLYMPTKIRP